MVSQVNVSVNLVTNYFEKRKEIKREHIQIFTKDDITKFTKVIVTIVKIHDNSGLPFSVTNIL